MVISLTFSFWFGITASNSFPQSSQCLLTIDLYLTKSIAFSACMQFLQVNLLLFGLEDLSDATKASPLHFGHSTANSFMYDCRTVGGPEYLKFLSCISNLSSIERT